MLGRMLMGEMLRGQRGMVVIMEGVARSGGPHRDALLVNGILGRTSSRSVLGGCGCACVGVCVWDIRRIEVAASERGVSRLAVKRTRRESSVRPVEHPATAVIEAGM